MDSNLVGSPTALVDDPNTEKTEVAFDPDGDVYYMLYTDFHSREVHVMHSSDEKVCVVQDKNDFCLFHRMGHSLLDSGLITNYKIVKVVS